MIPVYYGSYFLRSARKYKNGDIFATYPSFSRQTWNKQLLRECVEKLCNLLLHIETFYSSKRGLSLELSSLKDQFSGQERSK